METDIFVEESVDFTDNQYWTVGREALECGEDLLVTKRELLHLAHLLIKAYRRACEKEEMGL